MTKLPFGLRNAPAIFQRTMDLVLKDIQGVTVYIDDILVHSRTAEDHLEILTNVFRRLREFGLKAKPAKCCFARTNMTYLGHVLSGDGYKPSIQNREVVENFPRPKNLNEIKRFLGMAGFFRRFIPNFADKAAPLNQMLRGKAPQFEWKEVHETAFKSLKRFLSEAPCLRPPNYNLPFHLFTDFSGIAFGGALMQTPNGDEKNLHAVAFWSHSVNETEARYSATHGELAAIVLAVDALKPILYQSELIIHSDHRPLSFLFNKASTNAKLNRWLLLLQDLNPKIAYVEGSANRVADALSRVAISWEEAVSQNKDKEERPYLLLVEEAELPISKEQIQQATKDDPILGKVAAAIRVNWVEEDQYVSIKPYADIREKLTALGGLIWKDSQLVVPAKLREVVLQMLHRAHFGITRTKNKARRLVWWPKIGVDIENFVATCTICQIHAVNPPRSDVNYKWPEAKYAFERIHVDFAGPAFGFTWLIVIDAYSKYPLIKAMQSTSATATIAVLREIFALFGSPQTLVSDNGRQLVAEEMEHFLRQNAVKHLMSPAYHPASNGEAERMVREFKDKMTKIMAEPHTPPQEAALKFLQEYRSAVHTATGETPAALFLKREMRTPLDLLYFAAEAKENARSGRNTEQPRCPLKEFEIGESVWARDHRDGKNKKWIEATVTEAKGERMYAVRASEGETRIVHVDQMRKRKEGTRSSDATAQQ